MAGSVSEILEGEPDLEVLASQELNDFLKAGDQLVGDYTNSKYTISTVDLTPYRSVAMVVEPNPFSANVDDDYGYTETIVEYL